MSRTAKRPDVVAAGAVCWREVNGKLKVLVVHRDTHADVSLPKGKLDPGETPPETAAREVEEETGLRVALGVPLGFVGYAVNGGREKIVYYWACEVTDQAIASSSFTPNEEIAALDWLSLKKARKAVTYDRDRDVLDRFAEHVAAGTHKTFAVVALRHAKAVSPDNWDGPDETRPLLNRGLEQAESTSKAIAAYRPKRLLSSSAARCLSTCAPLATLTGLEVKTIDGISQDAFESGTSTVPTVVARQLAKSRTVVLCSHGPVLPEIIAAVARETGTPFDARTRNASILSTAEFSVLHVSRSNPSSGIVAIETHGPASRS